jgi:hypothetical protein
VFRIVCGTISTGFLCTTHSTLAYKDEKTCLEYVASVLVAVNLSCTSLKWVMSH